MDDFPQVPAGVDPGIPSVARMYDYYLGGKDNFASDREAAEKMIAIGRRAGSSEPSAVWTDGQLFVERRCSSNTVPRIR